MSTGRSPLAAGVALALLAAASFGLTIPLIALAGRDTGPLATAALLYAGACASALLLGRLAPGTGAPLERRHLARLLAVAVVGAGVAPTLLAWGLQRAGALTGSLLLNLEAVFTVALAALLFKEHLGGRVVAAVALMALGGAALTLASAQGAGGSLAGALAVTGATAAWALDNTLSRGLSEQDPVAVVAGKGGLGALLTGALAWALGESLPSAGSTALLLACGATGYGLSLRLYLLAQRRIGAARVGSVFAVAPFVGAALAWALGAAGASWLTALAAGLFAAGVLLHVTEHHHHEHLHPEVEHEHAHRHDDGHHLHQHPSGAPLEHSHPHRHGALSHEHPHAPDVHHDHSHA